MAEVQRVEKGNLILDGIPSIPDEIKDSLFPYQNTRQAVFRAWHRKSSDDVHGMLITTRFAETSQVHYVRAPLGNRKQLTFFNEAITELRSCPSSSSPNADTFLFSKDIGGNEKWQIYQFNLNTGKFRLISDGSSRNSAIRWSNQGDRYAFSSNRRNGKDMDIYVSNVVSIDTAVPQPTLVVQKGGTWSTLAWSPDDKHLLVKHYVSVSESYLYSVAIETGVVTAINEQKVKVAYGDACWAKDSKGVYVVCDNGGEFQQIRYWDLQSSSFTKDISTDIPWDVELVRMSPDGRQLAFAINEDGAYSLYIYHIDSCTRTKIPNIPVGIIVTFDWHPNNKKLAVTLNTPQTPGDIFLVELVNFQLERWTESEVGGLNTSQFIMPTLIHFPSFDGREIPAFYYKPKSETSKKFPVLIYIHGGPEGQFTPSFTWRFQYFLLELGIAVIAPNVRGSSGYGRSYLALDDGFLREDSVKDIGSLIDWINKQSELDSDRICVDGGSYGGYMVLASMIHYGEKLKAGMERVGISNFITFLENTAEYRRDLRRQEYGDERDPKMREFLIQISPTTKAHVINKPMLIAQGLNDPRVPAGESEQIVQAVRKHGVDVWYILAKDEGHGFSKKKNIDELTNTEMLFLKKHL